MLNEALERPSLLEGLAVNTYAGGVRRTKSRHCRGRISPRWGEGVSSATGKALLFAIILGCMPIPCLAQDMPGIGVAEAAPNVSRVTTASAATPAKSFPPPIQLLSPSAPLDRKSSVSIGLVHKWQAKDIKPTMGPRGEVRFIYGATQDTVIGAPLHVSDIALQPGEIVQNVNLGDATMWSCPPAISGTGANEITHLMCKPADAGLETNLAIQTSRRTYSIELRSTRKNYMPRVSWTYPEDQAAQWAAYQTHGGQQHAPLPVSGPIHYTITGDNPPWKPFDVFSDGQKTFLRFPPSMAYGTAPVLERLP